MPMMQQLTPARIVADTDSYLDFLAAQPGVAGGPVLAMGYCMGGRTALRAMAGRPARIKALAGFHAGGIVTDDPESVHLAVGSITGEVYFGFADHDRSMTAEQIKTFEAALADAGVTYTSEVYEGAAHGFTMSDTAMYDAAAEQRHWTNLFALLDRALPVN
jgi:carboxymethylenebutenolidase